MIVRIQHMNHTLGILAHTPRLMQLSEFSPRFAPCSEGAASQREFLDPVIAEFTDEDMPFAVEKKIVRVVELTACFTGFSKDMHDFWGFPGCIENLDSVIARVGHP